ncbi:DNA-directed DNA polymerase [Coemansia asiatica]|uniref:DNA-directed DNA polymerase n=1 Tax=Coemansia asiatica TaxID=1052880 RepID=A0A9W7XNZ8_9FUNG|nr:DNA-directed DNA polymerase [Coemansia asiatica]
MSSTTLDFYWGLSSLDANQRLESATQLISALVKFQEAMPLSKEVATTEEEMAKLCASDVSYAVTRLIKGLASPRDGARQGFSIALSELLARIPCISVKLVLSLLWRHTEATNSMKGQEQRDMRFGRIFGLMALVQSGIVARKGTTSVEIRKIVMELASTGAKKSYLREIAYVTLASIVPELSKFDFRDEAIAMFVTVALDKGVIETPDELFLAMCLRKTYTDYNWHSALPHWHGKHMLSFKNANKLVPILSEISTDDPSLFSSWSPQLHTVWNEIFDLYFNKDRADEVIVGGPMEFDALWDRVVEKGLFAPGASQFRRYWGFMVFERLLPHLNEDMVPLIMSPNILRNLSDNVSRTSKSPLTKVGMRTAEKLIEICEGNTKIGLAVLTHLLNQKSLERPVGTSASSLRFIMANRIVEKLDSKAIVGYIKYLQQIFLKPRISDKKNSGVADPNTVANAPNKFLDNQRSWAIEQMIRVAKFAQLPITDELTTNVLNFTIAHASFKLVTTVGMTTSGIPELDMQPSPPLSAATSEYCSNLLVAFISDLTRLNTHGGDASGDKEQPEDSQADASIAPSAAGRLSVGCSRAGIAWSTATIAKLLKDASKTKAKVALRDFDSIKPVLEDMLQVMRMLEAKCAEYAETSVETALRFRALELFLGNICVLVAYSFDPNVRAEYIDMLPELKECSEKLVALLDTNSASAAAAKSKQSKKGKKTKKDNDEEEEPQPMDVLTDIIISLLAKDSTSVRKLCVQVFTPFAGMITANGMDSITGVLEAKEGVSGEEGGDVETQIEMIDDIAVDSDEEMGGDNEDDGNGADDNANGEAVDEELRRKIEEALGSSVDIDEREVSASGDEEEFDDEQMKVFDDKLAEIFQQKKQMKQDVRDLKISFVNFKLRVLDLVDVFLTRQPESPLVLQLLPVLLDLIRSTTKDSRNRPIHDRACSIVSARRSKLPTGFDTKEGLDLLTSIHERARRASDKHTLTVVSGVAMFMARAVVENDSSAESAVYDLYRASLSDFMTRKASQMISEFFTAPASRSQPARLLPFWRLAVDAVTEYGHPLKAVNVFRQVQAYVLAAGISSNVSRLDALDDTKPFVDPTSRLLAGLQSAVLETVKFAASDKNKSSTTGKLLIDQQRLREILQASSQLIAKCAKSKAFGKVAKETLRSTAEWTEAFDALSQLPSFTTSNAMVNVCNKLKGLEVLVSPSSGDASSRKNAK